MIYLYWYLVGCVVSLFLIMFYNKIIVGTRFQYSTSFDYDETIITVIGSWLTALFIILIWLSDMFNDIKPFRKTIKWLIKPKEFK